MQNALKYLHVCIIYADIDECKKDNGDGCAHGLVIYIIYVNLCRYWWM